MTDPTTNEQPQAGPVPGTRASGSTFTRRLGYYLGGVSIGLVMLGIFQIGRNAASRAEDDHRDTNPAATGAYDPADDRIGAPPPASNSPASDESND